MDDSKKCNDFFGKILAKDRYPDYLKSLIDISDDTKRSLLECIRDYQEYHHQNNPGYIESVLVNRFLKPSPFLKKKFKKIRGPISLYQMSHPNTSEYPQIFYLFGDYHDQLSKCPRYDINEWLMDTIFKSPVFIDVFIESAYSYKKYHQLSPEGLKSVDSYLLDTYFSFKDCFLKKHDPICQTSRFHYTDMRIIFETKQQADGYLASSYPNKQVTAKIIHDLNAYIYFLLNKNSFVHKRIKKQFNNITDPDIRKTLERDFKECQEKYQENIKPINLYTLVQKGDPVPTMGQVIDSSLLHDYSRCLMDYYLMARCFRTYAKGAKYQRPSYNNIIYTGGGHTVNYVDILLKLGFVIDFEKINFDAKDPDILEKIASVGIKNWVKSVPNFQCLDVSEMKQPMFYQRYT